MNCNATKSTKWHVRPVKTRSARASAQSDQSLRCALKGQLRVLATSFALVGWWFGFNGPLRQYFSLYRAVSQREGERGERIDESKNIQTTPTRTYYKCSRPLPYCNPNCLFGSLPSTIAPPDHPHLICETIL